SGEQPVTAENEINVNGTASGILKLSGNLMTENEQGEESLSWRGLTGTATFNQLLVNLPEFSLAADGPMIVELKSNEIVFHDTHFTGTQTNLTLGGALATSAGGRNTLAINGRINLRILGLFSPDLISSGIAELAVNVGGTVDNQRITGRASMSGATISAYLGD